MATKHDLMKYDPEILSKAVQLRISGMDYNSIAKVTGITNLHAMTAHIQTALQTEVSKLQANLLAVLAIDLVRLEALLPENMRLAQGGSDKHVNAVIAIINAKLKLIKEYADLQRSNLEAATAAVPSVRDSDEAYKLAEQRIKNDADAYKLPVPDVDVELLPEEELASLRAMVTDMEMNINLQKGLKDGTDNL